MDILFRCLEFEITKVKDFPPGVFDLPGDPLIVQILNRIMIIDEKNKTVENKKKQKIHYSPENI